GLILKNIFAYRPYTRSVTWGKAYRILVNYMKKNELESGVQQMRSSPVSNFAKSSMPKFVKNHTPDLVEYLKTNPVKSRRTQSERLQLCLVEKQSD
ncbi:MAG: hypothetical protein ABL927_13775, partial [Bdellovibrionales bacterium]